MINADSHYVIGQSHLNNEDYAISGMEPFPYVIIADGCSSSDYCDIGARMLIMSAKEFIISEVGARNIPDAEQLALYAALKTEASIRIAGVPESSMDATLLVSFVVDDRVYVYLFGDGAVFYTTSNGDFSFTNVDYSHNAPYYPSYRVNSKRNAEYKAISCDGNKTHYKVVHTLNKCEFDSVLLPTVLSFSTDNLDSLLIASDGISSFLNTTNTQSYENIEVARLLSDFRNTKGQFVKRKLNRTLKVLAKDGVVNSDDLSVGAFVFG